MSRSKRIARRMGNPGSIPKTTASPPLPPTRGKAFPRTCRMPILTTSKRSPACCWRSPVRPRKFCRKSPRPDTDGPSGLNFVPLNARRSAIMSEAAPASPGLLRASATRFIVLLGLVSLCADMTYEGARSVTGPYLGMLGASAAIVGFIAGLGEFLGYALRLLSGYLTDRTGAYWPITFLGYGVNLVAVPRLALAGSWELAVLLIVAERAGKAIRAPARDAMLSHAGSQTGLGFAFGLHGALDQTGAIPGPMIVSAALYWKGGYQTGFAILAIPALCAMLILAAARHLYPRPRDLEVTLPDLT